MKADPAYASFQAQCARISSGYRESQHVPTMVQEITGGVIADYSTLSGPAFSCPQVSVYMLPTASAAIHQRIFASIFASTKTAVFRRRSSGPVMRPVPNSICRSPPQRRCRSSDSNGRTNGSVAEVHSLCLCQMIYRLLYNFIQPIYNHNSCIIPDRTSCWQS